MSSSENRFLALAARAAAESWDEERAAQELAATFVSGLTQKEHLEAIQAIANSDLPAEVAIWIDRLTAILMAISNASEDAGPLHLNLAVAWLQRAQAGDPGGYGMALQHCQAARPFVPEDDPNYSALQQIEAVAASRGASQALMARLQRLLNAEDEAALAAVVDEWPEALGSKIQQLLRTLAAQARQAGDEEIATRAETTQVRLQVLRTARPQDAALADFLETGTWEEAQALVHSTPALRDWKMVERLAALAEQAQAQGEEQEAKRYQEHQQRLARWLGAYRHPLLQMAYQVRRGDVSLAQALEEALKPESIAALDEERLDTLADFSQRLALEDLQVAYLLARLNDAVAPRVAGPRVQAHCALRVGQLGRGRGEDALIMERLEHALQLYGAIGDQVGQANAHHSIGEVQRFGAQYDDALGSYEEALRLYREVGDRLGQANAHRGIGEVQRFRDQYDAALGSYKKALGLYGEVGDRRGQANAHHSIGEVQQFRAQYDDALGSYQEALRLCEEVGDRIGLINARWAIGRVWRQQGSLLQAHQFFFQALSALEEVRGFQQREDSRRALLAQGASLYTAMIDTCLALRRFDEAWHWLERSKGRGLLDLFHSAPPRLHSPEQKALYERWLLLGQKELELEQKVRALDEKLRDFSHNLADRPRSAGDLPSSRAEVDREITNTIRQLVEVRQEKTRLEQRLLQEMDEGRELIRVSVPAAEDLALSLRSLALSQNGTASRSHKPLLVEYALSDDGRYRVFLLPLWEVSAGKPLPLEVREGPESNLQRPLDIFQAGWLAARQAFAGRYRGEAPVEAGETAEPEQDRTFQAVQALFQRLAHDQPDIYEPYLREVLPALGSRLTDRQRWIASQVARAAFATLPDEIGQVFLQPWAEALAHFDPTDLILVPHGPLHFLPLHAASLSKGIPLIEQYPLVYLPNAALAETLVKRREAGYKPTERLVMGPPDEEDLPGAGEETDTLAEQWGLKIAGQPMPTHE